MKGEKRLRNQYIYWSTVRIISKQLLLMRHDEKQEITQHRAMFRSKGLFTIVYNIDVLLKKKEKEKANVCVERNIFDNVSFA